jgi:hypothetical protein
MEQQLAELREDLELMLEAGVVDETRGEELSTRLQDLQRRIQEGEVTELSDVDALEELLAHELAEQNARLTQALAQLSAFALGQAPGTSPGEEATAFAEMLENARTAGLLVDLPPELAALLGQFTGTGGEVDPAALPTSLEDLQRLAQALAQSAEDQLGGMALQGLVEPGELADLRSVLAQYDMPGQGAGPGALPGRGGVSRGRADATLDYTNQTEGDTSAFEARRLLPGRKLPRRRRPPAPATIPQGQPTDREPEDIISVIERAKTRRR